MCQLRAESALFGSEPYQKLFTVWKNQITESNAPVLSESNTSHLYQSAFIMVPYTVALHKGTRTYFAQAFTD